VTWHALTVGVCNQCYLWQLVIRGWRPDWENNRAVRMSRREMIDKTRVEWSK